MLDEIEEDCWFDPLWFEENKLTVHTVIEYFKLSPFYQSTSLFESQLTLKIKIEAQDESNFIISKNLEDDQNKTRLIGIYRVFDNKIYKGINLKQYIENQISSIQGNISDILAEVKKNCNWNDLKKKWEGEQQDVKEEKTISLKDDFY